MLRRRLVGAHRSRQRARRLRAEAAGNWAYSRPALYDMDRKIDEFLPGHDGFFIEAGGNDGFRQSNTYHLERRRSWRGLLVEPVPALAAEARIERPHSAVVSAALVAEGYEEPTARIRYGGLMSVVCGARGDEAADEDWVMSGLVSGNLGLEDGYELDVPARTLSEILDEINAPEIDLLSLDVEGYEPQVLAGLDLDRHAPRFALIEVRDDLAHAEVRERLDDRYELVEMFSPFDAFYRRTA
ncbi:MAG: FkbM family methyltransferase [Solirubrobacteraceae bacterium]|nr:FkbM family methyltransferase [Solirubrobacteraceae bacterium]